MQDYVRELDQPELTQHVKDRESLTALVYNEPEGALQSILPQKRAEWNQIVAGDRERLISLGRYCTPSGGSLVFTFMLNNPGEASVSVTEIVHHRLFDYGEAGGGDPSTPNVFEPEIDYVHDVAFRCEGPEETEAIALPLSPPLRIAPGQASSFELITNYTISGYPGAFLAPIKMRLDIVTSAGTVSTTVFLVEAPSCAG